MFAQWYEFTRTIEVFRSHHIAGVNTEIPAKCPYTMIFPVRRSSTLDTSSDSLFDAHSNPDSTEMSWSHEVGPPQSSTNIACTSDGLNLDSGLEEDLSDWDFCMDFGLDLDGIDSDVDDSLFPINCPMSCPLSAGVPKTQSATSRDDKESPNASAPSRTSSSGHGLVSCPEGDCDSVFTGQTAKKCLARHMKEVHEKQGRYPCSYCAVKFSREWNRRRHMRMYHKCE